MLLQLVDDDGNVFHVWRLQSDLDIPDVEEINGELPQEWHDSRGTPEQQDARKKRRLARGEG